MRSREVLMCSERYAEDIPLTLPYTQLPPTRSEASKQSKSNPFSCRALAAAMPDEPAPITHTSSSAPIPTAWHEDDADVKFVPSAGCAPCRSTPTTPT